MGDIQLLGKKKATEISVAFFVFKKILVNI